MWKISEICEICSTLILSVGHKEIKRKFSNWYTSQIIAHGLHKFPLVDCSNRHFLHLEILSRFAFWLDRLNAHFTVLIWWQPWPQHNGAKSLKSPNLVKFEETSSLILTLKLTLLVNIEKIWPIWCKKLSLAWLQAVSRVV